MQLEGTTKQGPPPFFMVAKEYVPIFLGSSPPRSWRCAVGVELQTLASSSPSHEPALGGLRQFRSETKENSKSCRRRRGLIKTTIIIEKNQIVSKPNPMNLRKTDKKAALAASFLVRPRSGRERDLLCPPPPGSSEKCTSAARPCQAMRVGSASG